MPRFALPSTSNNPQNVLEAPTTFQRVSSPQTMDNLLQMEDVFSLSNHNHLPETGVFTGDPKYSAPPDVAPSVPFGHESSEDTGLPEGTDFIHRPSPGVATLDRIPGTQSSLHSHSDEADYVSSLRLITKDSQLSRLMTTINNKSSKEAQSSCIYDDGAVSIESNDQEGRPLKYPKLNKKHSFRDNTLDKMKSDLIRKVPHQRGVGKRNYRNEDDYGRDLIFMEQLYAIAKSPILPEDHTNTEWYKEWKKSQILKSSLKRKENFLAPELYLLLLLHESNDIDQFAFLLMCTYNDWMVGKSTQNFQYKAIGREFTMGRLTDVWQRYLQSSLSLVGLFEPNSKKLKEYPITFEKITINRFLEISNWMWQVQCLYKTEFGTSMKLPGTLTGSLMRKITAFTLHTFEQSDKLRVYLQERLKVKSMPFWDSVLQEKNFKIANGLSWDNLEKLTNSLLHQYKYSEDHMKLATDWGFEGSESKKLWQLVSEFEMATKQQQMGMDLVYEEMNVYLHINGLDSIQTKKGKHITIIFNF
ncbi:hypothetical protein DFH28DRAFT_923815 [Melampsora americana]|nr:hypothetical protein DFH28DRAFT_923815 [Melampsora americana]